MHYLGKRLYSRHEFERETNKLGVQRSIAFRILPNFCFGQPVLLAYYKPGHELAEFIGYLRISGLSHTLPEKIARQINTHLTIENFSHHPKRLTRRCGTYTIGLTLIVKETLREIIGFIREECEKHRLNPEKYKYFLTGSYHPFPTPVTVTDMKFFRGYKKIECEIYPDVFLELLSQIPEFNTLEWIYDYEGRRYITKKALAELEAI